MKFTIYGDIGLDLLSLMLRQIFSNVNLVLWFHDCMNILDNRYYAL
jgi:hypothetical protein